MTETASSVLAKRREQRPKSLRASILGRVPPYEGGALMHLAEGMLPLSQAVAWSALTAPAVVWSLRRCPLGQTQRVC